MHASKNNDQHSHRKGGVRTALEELHDTCRPAFGLCSTERSMHTCCNAKIQQHSDGSSVAHTALSPPSPAAAERLHEKTRPQVSTTNKAPTPSILHRSRATARIDSAEQQAVHAPSSASGATAAASARRRGAGRGPGTATAARRGAGPRGAAPAATRARCGRSRSRTRSCPRTCRGARPRRPLGPAAPPGAAARRGRPRPEATTGHPPRTSRSSRSPATAAALRGSSARMLVVAAVAG